MSGEKNGENEKEDKEEQVGEASKETSEGSPDDDYSAEEEAEIQKRLEDLGYI